MRYPGQSLDKKIDDLRWEIGLLVGFSSIFVVVAYFELWRWYRHLPPQPQITGVAATVIVAYSYIRIRRIMKQLPGYRQGQLGEREVGHILNQLIAQGYTIFHDVLAPHFNIDHVVVSPRGIFAIETKAISKPPRGSPEIEFDGEKVTLKGHLPNAEHLIEAKSHADWLRKQLGNKVSERKDFPVKPVVVYPGWYYRDTGHNRDIWVLNPKCWKTNSPGVAITNRGRHS